MGKPFKVGGQPARRNPGSTTQSQRKGKQPEDTYGERFADTTPDGDVGSNDPEEAAGSDGYAQTVQAPANPWPPARAVAHKPFKV